MSRNTTFLKRTLRRSLPWSLALFVACGTALATAPLPPPPDIPYAGAPAPGVFTGGRFGAAEVPKIDAAGVRHVIDLTQPSEDTGFDEAAALQDVGIGYSRLPVSATDGLTRENVVAFDQLLRDAPTPVLVHCGSSNRVGALAALRAAWLQGADDEAALAIGRAWGLTKMEPAVREALSAD